MPYYEGGSAVTNSNCSGRQLGYGEGAVQTQPSAKELRRDGEDHALPQLDMSAGCSRLRCGGENGRSCRRENGSNVDSADVGAEGETPVLQLRSLECTAKVH